MAAARYRAINGCTTERRHARAEPLHLGLVCGRHLGPDFAGCHGAQHTVSAFDNLGRCRRAWQAGDDQFAVSRHLRRAFPPHRTTVKERPGCTSIEIAYGEIMTVAQQAARQLRADIAKADKSNLFIHR